MLERPNEISSRAGRGGPMSTKKDAELPNDGQRIGGGEVADWVDWGGDRIESEGAADAERGVCGGRKS